MNEWAAFWIVMGVLSILVLWHEWGKIMAEYIERKAIEERLRKIPPTVTANAQFFINEIRGITAADVAPVRHGRWIKPTRVPDSMLDECSLCGFDCGSYTYNYCPNCGARMDGEDHG